MKTGINENRWFRVFKNGISEMSFLESMGIHGKLLIWIYKQTHFWRVGY